jgi:hypothetical protein
MQVNDIAVSVAPDTVLRTELRPRWPCAWARTAHKMLIR